MITLKQFIVEITYILIDYYHTRMVLSQVIISMLTIPDMLLKL